MTAVLLVKCDGRFPQPGRGACSAYLALAAGDASNGRRIAQAAGWTVGKQRGLLDRVRLRDDPEQDLCPSHTRLATP